MPCTVLVGLVFGARKVRSEKYPPLQQVGLQLAEVLCGLGLAVGGGSPADDIDQRETARVAGKIITRRYGTMEGQVRIRLCGGKDGIGDQGDGDPLAVQVGQSAYHLCGVPGKG